MKKIALSDRADAVIKLYPSLSTLKTVIEKELIHYDIFFLLQQKELILPDMAFIGGTCLRLCHGSNRYSEDIDFHAGIDFKPDHFDKIRLEIERFITDRYGLEVEVRSPKEMNGDQDYSNANTWKVIIKTRSKRPDLPSQRIHIDIANIPTHETKPLLIRTNYTSLPDGYDRMLFKSSSKAEILADKLVALPARNNIKARDIWDLIWLQQQNTTADSDLVLKKISDHEMVNFKERLENRINNINSYFETGVFEMEMSRFLDSNHLAETIKKPEFRSYVAETVAGTLKKLHSDLYTTDSNKPKFKL